MSGNHITSVNSPHIFLWLTAATVYFSCASWPIWQILNALSVLFLCPSRNGVSRPELCACDKQFLLFPQCFLLLWRTFCHFHQVPLFPKTTNFRLFQNVGVCSQQIQIWWKWQKNLRIDRKHCGKRKNFFFSLSVFKRLVMQTCKRPGVVWEIVN